MCASPGTPSGRTTTVGRAGEKKRQDKGVNLLSQVAPHEYFTDLHIAKGKAAAGSGSLECIGFPLAWRQITPKSDWGKCPHSLALPACSNFRTAKFCRWGSSPRKGVLSKRHSPQFPRQAPASLPCTSKSSSHPPCPMPQDECHLTSH